LIEVQNTLKNAGILYGLEPIGVITEAGEKLIQVEP
jgi:hypothetical protein